MKSRVPSYYFYENTKTSSRLMGAKVRRHSPPNAARAQPCYTVYQSNWTTTHHCECILVSIFIHNFFLPNRKIITRVNSYLETEVICFPMIDFLKLGTQNNIITNFSPSWKILYTEVIIFYFTGQLNFIILYSLTNFSMLMKYSTLSDLIYHSD